MYEYTRKSGVEHVERIAAEKRKDARTARETLLACLHEQGALAHEYSQLREKSPQAGADIQRLKSEFQQRQPSQAAMMDQA
ncbi:MULTISPECIES: hypothetical protein [Vreelandella]|uniref:Uncharacterized protein n=1 Tax=Vreelandella titanicae TaxID=664683 RepID=A0A558J0Z3_9GAMM|nr:hypothetical protein [Halomonas titanicae]TVU87264.1 hypothetical protein FQP89_22020 [Halomonas titanicae]